MVERDLAFSAWASPKYKQTTGTKDMVFIKDILDHSPEVTSEEDVMKLLKAEAEKGLEDLYYFDKYILGYKDMEETPHRELCNFMYNNQPPIEQEGPEGYIKYNGLKRKLIEEPRGSFKSSVVTCGYSLHRMVLNPNIRILIASEKLHIAQKFLSEIKGHISRNDYFRTLYGVMDTKKDDQSWNLSEITTSTRTKNLKEPTVSTAGVDVTKVGMHYDLIIVDDPVSQNNITSKEQIDKVLEWFKLLYSLLDPGGELVVIGTRWDYGDLYGTLQEEPYVGTFDILIRKAEWEDGGERKLLFPQRLSHEFLDETKKMQGVYQFSCQYLNDPVPRGEAEFREDYFRYYLDADMRSTDLAKYMCLDPAISMSAQADYTVFVIVGVDEKNNLYILHIDRGKYTPSQIIDKFMQKAKLYGTIANGLETNAYQKMLKYQLNDRMRETGEFYNITELKLNKNVEKEYRIRRLQPRYEQGTIFHRRNDLGISELEYELLHFPKAKHDDIADALASTLEILQVPMSRSSKNKKKHKKHYRSKITKW